MLSDSNLWDFILVIVVTVQAGILAYVSDPKKKSLILTFPFPFTLATISLGGIINATNVIGLINLVFFTYGVWFFYTRLSLNIVFSIVFFAIVYCIIGVFLSKILPATELAFWVSALAVIILALCLALFTGCVSEKPYRTNLPVLVKIPVIAATVIFLVSIKKYLSGFMTVFPMVGVIAAYEGRYMLASICRQMPLIIIGLTSLMMTTKIFMKFTGLYLSLFSGWVVFLIVLKITGDFLWNQFCLENLRR